MSQQQDTYALAWKAPDASWFYIPTAPTPARTWRGPFPTRTHMEAKCCGELGADVTIVHTTVNGAIKNG